MSKKDFIALADTIRDYNETAEDIGQKPFDRRHLDVLASFCMDQNSQFKWSRWMDYVAGKCGKNGGAIKPKIAA